MDRKRIAIAVETVPVVSVALSILLLALPYDSALIRNILKITFLLAFLGFLFCFIGRRLARGDRTVRILGILDWLATLSIIGYYTLAIFYFGL